ncbi:chemotaxis protein [Vibrio genomosp. F10]|uniref:Chemotaxis protein n=1 Tax=Vibrio genomosp. F10 TaxID=723171 RepID=A0A1B9QYL3_9VIBR|nr:chemotaxis protein [Vibrio genomosp. F10]OCH75440.1 chemotaxis protein [Vibrio genomosp. F10]
MYCRRLSQWLLCCVALSLSGCSLLEVKIDTQTTPLTQQELNMRLLIREYAQTFFSQVEQTADTISDNYPADDAIHQSYLLLWKINATEGMQSAAYQGSPTAALIDSWVFSYQMAAYFEQRNSTELFQLEQATSVSKLLAEDMDQRAKSLLKKSVYQSMRSFVQQFSLDHPFSDISLSRTPAYRQWLTINQINQGDVKSTMGTMPEALGDVSDKLSLVAEQTPKVMTWKAQLMALNSNISGQEISETLQSVQATSRSFQDFVENNPEYMKVLAEQMAVTLQPLVNDIDNKTNARLVQLGGERKALEAMVENERVELIKMIEKERKAIAVIVSSEREKFTQDIDKVSQDIVILAVDKMMELVKSLILYFVLFLGAIFFAPLGLGYFLGKRAANKS